MNEVNVERIVELCGLEDLHTDSNGWRARSPYRIKDSNKDDNALSISRAGVFTCHATKTSGHVVELYAFMKGKSLIMARKELKLMELINRDFNMVKVNHTEEEKKEVDRMDKVGKLLSDCIPEGNADWTHFIEWRKISKETVAECAERQSIKMISTNLGTAYCFFATEPPCDGELPQLRAAMQRFVAVENKDKEWVSVGSYPIWAPWWIKEAKNVFLFEGNCDALACMDYLESLPPESQPLGLVGGKDIGKHREIMEYFEGKTVYVIPDADEPGEKILQRTLKALDDVECEKRLLRYPKDIKSKDFNDWVKEEGLTQERFKEWIATAQTYELRDNGRAVAIIDDDYCAKHGVKKDEFFLVDDELNPVQVETKKWVETAPWQPEEIFDLVKPYPLLFEYVQQCSFVQEAPILWHLTSFLSFFGGALGRRIKFESGSSGCLYPHTYSILVGPSGHGKNESINMMKNIVCRVCPRSDKWSYFGASEFSKESFYTDLNEYPHKHLIFYEMKDHLPDTKGSYQHQALLALIDMYDSHQYNDKHPKIGKFKTYNYCIKTPMVSVIAGAVDSQLASVDENTFKGGMVGRFLFAYGPYCHRDVSMPSKIPEETEAKVEGFFKSVFETPFIEGRVMRMTAKAMAIYDAEYHKHKEANRARPFSEDANTYVSRWRVQVLKFAMHFELLSGRHEFPLKDVEIKIHAESMYSAIRLTEIFEHCFFSLFSRTIQGNELSSDGRIQKRIMKFMENSSTKEGVAKSQIINFIQERGMTIDANLEALIEAGKLVTHKIKTKGKPRTVYFLPKVKEVAV